MPFFDRQAKEKTFLVSQGEWKYCDQLRLRSSYYILPWTWRAHALPISRRLQPPDYSQNDFRDIKPALLTQHPVLVRSQRIWCRVWSEFMCLGQNTIKLVHGNVKLLSNSSGSPKYSVGTTPSRWINRMAYIFLFPRITIPEYIGKIFLLRPHRAIIASDNDGKNSLQCFLERPPKLEILQEF